MIRLKIKKRFYSYERVIFPSGNIKSEADITRYMRFYDEVKIPSNVVVDSYITPVTDLTEAKEEIQKKYSKDVRYEVRRAGREHIRYIIYDKLDSERDEKFITDVAKKYYEFCDSINQPVLKHNLELAEIMQFVQQGNLLITKAEFEKGWTYHIYQIDGKYAMLWFSFSDYRKDGANKSMAGWANRGLHDHDIMYFKDCGYKYYDWGNIASLEEPNHIDKFKMSFGGEIKTAYGYFIGNTIKGKILVYLRNKK